MIKKHIDLSVEECINLLADSPIRQAWLVRSLDSLKWIWTYEYIDDDSLDRVGLCIFVSQEASDTFVKLLYLYVEEAYRGNGIATAMIEQASCDIRVEGYSYMTGFVINGEEKPDFYDKCGFSHFRREINMVYDTEILLASEVLNKREKLDPLLEHVYLLDDLDFEVRNGFFSKVYKSVYGADIRKTDPNLARCYVKNGEAVAGISFRKDHNDNIIMTGLYVDRDKADKFSVPAMMLSLLFSLEGIENDVVLFFTSQAQVDMVIEYFDRPRLIVETETYNRSF